MSSFAIDIWEQAQNDLINKLLAEGKTQEDIEKAFSEIDYKQMIDDFTNHIAEDTLKTLEKTMFEKARDSESHDAEFIARNRQKWGKAFVAFRALYEICLEAAQYYCEYVDSLSLNEKKQNQYTFLAIREMHGRACQMYLEILCLMEHGFVDGAYARWRSLYELVIIADFITKNGEGVAKAYYEHIDEKDDYRWASQADCFKNVKYISFNKIREQSAIPKGTWEQPYQLGNKIVHATAEGTFKRMGNWEGMSECIPVGQSDYGFSTPGEHSAIMLSIITIMFLTILTNIDSIVFGKVIDKWVDIVRKHFFAIAYQNEDEKDLFTWLKENAPEMIPGEPVSDHEEGDSD